MSHILSKYLNNYTIKAQIRKYLLGCKIAIESRAAAGGRRRQEAAVAVAVQSGGSRREAGGAASKDIVTTNYFLNVSIRALISKLFNCSASYNYTSQIRL